MNLHYTDLSVKDQKELMLWEDHDKAHKYNGPVMFVTHKRFAVLFFLHPVV